MSSVLVQHDVLFTSNLLFRQTLHYSSECFLDTDLSLFIEAVFLSVRFLSLPKTISNSRERCMINQKAQTSLFFKKSKYLPPMWGIFPSVGDMRAAVKKLFCQPSDEPQRTFVKDYERSFFFFVIEMLRSSDQWEKDKRAAWEPNRKSLWTLGRSSRSVSEKHF